MKIIKSLIFSSFICRDRTPNKSPVKSQAPYAMRSTTKKRLQLGSNNEREILDSPEEILNSKNFSGNLANGLRGLSHEQLVKMVMDLVEMQEDESLNLSTDKLKEVILKRMPVADIQPLRERLIFLRTNIYASMVSSNIDESAYSRAFVHLDNYEVERIKKCNFAEKISFVIFFFFFLESFKSTRSKFIGISSLDSSNKIRFCMLVDHQRSSWVEESGDAEHDEKMFPRLDGSVHQSAQKWNIYAKCFGGLQGKVSSMKIESLNNDRVFCIKTCLGLKEI